VVAIGAQKARSVAECLRRGLINHLICSADLAGQLEKLFPTPTA
jgi:DNA-binding transcriptional regulator LsrR (DeoR family)